MSAAQKSDEALAERARDPAYWAQLHVRSDRSKAILIGRQVKRLMMGEGVRTERGGFKPENRP